MVKGKAQIKHRPIHGGNRDWAAQLAGCPATEILDFSASVNPLGPPPSAIAAIEAHLEDLQVYPDPNYASLRQVLGDAHQLPPEWILPGNGVAELLTWVGRDLAQMDATYLVTPAFNDYRRALRAANARVVDCCLNLESLGKGLSPWTVPPTLQPHSGLLVNNPHNPTGCLFPTEVLRPYLEQFELVVVDEAFMDFVALGEQPSLLDQVLDAPNLVILRSLTKFYSLPGLRIGYAIGHPDRLRCWQQWRDPWPVNALAAAAAIAVIQDQSFQQATRDWLTPAKLQLFTGLAELPGLAPILGSANYLLVQTTVPGTQLQQQLLQYHQLLIRDCLSFRELGDDYFRVAVRTPTDNHKLLQALTIQLPHA